MAIAETAHLIVDLRLQDQLSAGATQARAAIAGLEAQGKQATSGIGALGATLKTAALGFGAFAVASGAADILGGAVDAASALNETLSKSQAVFGQSAAAIETWGKTAATSMGLSEQAAVEAAASFGNMFKAMGLSQGASVGMSKDLVALASDLASFNNIGTDEALEKLRSGLVGEAEPLRSVGVLLNEATVTAKAVELGFTRVNGVFTEAQKVQARYALILEQTKTAQGDFAKTSAGLANSQRIANAELQDAMAQLGASLVPIATEAVKAIATVGKAAAQAAKDVGQFVGIAGDLIDKAAQIKAQATDGFRLPIVADAMDAVATAARQLQQNNIALLTPMIATSAAANQQATELADVTRAHLLASEAADEQTAAQQRLEAATSGSMGTFNGWTIAVGNAGASMTTLAGSIQQTSDPLTQATLDAEHFKEALDALPNEVQVNIRVRTIAEGAGGRNVAEKIGTATDIATGAGDPTIAQGNADFLRDNAARQKQIDDARAADRKAAADKAKAEADKAAAEAKQRAAEIARANREEVAGSYDDIKRAADRLFNSLHDRHIKAIQDAATLAQKQHDAAIQRIDDALKVQEAENAKPADTAEKAQTAREQAESRRGLVEALQAAQAAQLTNTDATRAVDLARSVRDATEALQNFDARATIGRLRSTEDVQNAQAEAQAKKDRDKADADLEAAKAKAAADEKAVTAADKKKADDFGRALDALRKKDEQDPRKFLTDAKALEARFGIFTDQAGFRHIGDAVASSLAKVKFPPPIINMTNKFSVTLNGRDIAAAVATANQPSAAPGVRSGQAGRAA